jgi:hypothetical protein
LQFVDGRLGLLHAKQRITMHLDDWNDEFDEHNAAIL